MQSVDYSCLPEHIQEGMRLYIESKKLPGGFLTAVLNNDLMSAYARADSVNQARMRDIVLFLFNEAPVECWGSPEKVKKWLGENRDALNG